MKLVCLCLTFLLPLLAEGQIKAMRSSYMDATIAIGGSQGTVSLLYGFDWRLGKKQKFGIGLGSRFTSYIGSNQYFETAPANLTSGGSGPGVIFKETITANVDTLLIASPQVNMFNVYINLSYPLGEKLLLGFNIDAAGFSFGGSKPANYINGFVGNITSASPTSFNLLLISDNDLGSLNSELFLKYQWKARWSLKGAVQFLFTEYTTITEVQQFPEPNDRFRNKALLAAVGISYQLN